MPVAISYPGVYIEELSSGVHTITGVATSIAAFVGWAYQGPVDEAVMVESWSEFESQFGGLSNNNGIPNYLGYAVNQFFANGGSQAYIVRVVWNSTLTAASGTPTAPATATATVGLFTLYAANPGLWGNDLQVSITSVSSTSRFTLNVLDENSNILESFPNLSISPTDPEYVVAVIDNDSQYITFVNPASPTAAITPPTGTVAAVAATALASGADGTVMVPNSDGNFEVALGLNPPQSAFGVHLLDRVPIFNLLCVPGMCEATNIQYLQAYCAGQRAMYLVDSAPTATVTSYSTTGPVGFSGGSPQTTASIQSTYSENSAFYFPWISAPDPAVGNRPALFPPSGFVAGLYAATDASRGVWKAPAGIAAGLTGVLGLQYNLTDAENGDLNPLAANCLRQFRTYGNVIWGARTLAGSDNAGSQWQYVPIRRLALYIESSLYDGTQWVVFEPNDEPLWGQIRMNVGAFMQGLFLQGAFQGSSPTQAYFVKCDSENNPQSSIDQGIVNVLVGFAPLYPAEFVIIEIQQIALQS
jgi:phage tail sheath protein FI